MCIMQLYVEYNCCNSHEFKHKVISLSWMKDVDEYCGFLATCCEGGYIGITCTSICDYHIRNRKACNLYNHQHSPDVIKVIWNDVIKELASCDESGTIYLWVPQRDLCASGRRYKCEISAEIQSEEIIVVDMVWSHDARTLLVCQNNGRVTAVVVDTPQRISFTLMYPRSEHTFVCFTFSPDDTSIYFGTHDGFIVVYNLHGDGNLKYGRVNYTNLCPITCVTWNCPKFLTAQNRIRWEQKFVFASGLADGTVCLMKDYDDLEPNIIHTDLYGMRMQWNSSGEFLAVVGYKDDLKPHDNSKLNFKTYIYSLQIISKTGCRIKGITISHSSEFLPIMAVSNLEWGHDDKRVFVAVGCHVYSVQVSLQEGVTNLQQICCTVLCSQLRRKYDIPSLPLPPSVKEDINPLLHSTIILPLPLNDRMELRRFLCRPIPNKERIYCTLRKGKKKSVYKLCLEHLGNLVPILLAKRLSGMNAEFVIFEPLSRESISDSIDGHKMEDSFCRILALVISNITKTRFEIYDCKDAVYLGNIKFKPSLLRIWPRELTVTLLHRNSLLEDAGVESQFCLIITPVYDKQVFFIDYCNRKVKYKRTLLPLEFFSEYQMFSQTWLLNSCQMSSWIMSEVIYNISKGISIENISLFQWERYDVNLQARIRRTFYLQNILTTWMPVYYVKHASYIEIYDDIECLMNNLYTEKDKSIKTMIETSIVKMFNSSITFAKKIARLGRINNCVNHNRKQGIVIHNTSPVWNQTRALYELIFGGRAILQSEKNCQFDYEGETVLQMGKISKRSFTLDFVYPFSAIQAFALALSSITHGMK